MADVDLELVRHALSTARAHGFAEVEIAVDGGSFAAKLQPASKKARAAAAASGVDPNAEPALVPITAPVVGYFRDGKTPLSVGASIKAGDIVGSVSSLGLANDIESKLNGEIIELLVEAGQAVEYGQPIALVRPA